LHTVSFGKLPAAHGDPLMTALQRSIDLFMRDMQQVRFVTDPPADFRYLDFRLETFPEQQPAELQLQTRFTLAGGGAVDVDSGWYTGHEESVRRLFLQIVEKTLFDDARGAYRPLTIQRCSALDSPPRVDVTISPAAGAALLDRQVSYILGDWNRQRTAVLTSTVLLDLDVADSATPELRGRFVLIGPASSSSNFLKLCHDGQAHGVLIPRVLPRLARGRRNTSMN